MGVVGGVQSIKMIIMMFVVVRSVGDGEGFKSYSKFKKLWHSITSKHHSVIAY